MAEFTKITSEDRADKGVSGLPDTPDMTAAKLQERFDSLANLAIDAINRLAHELGLASAASKIGTSNGTLQSWIATDRTSIEKLTNDISDLNSAISSLNTTLSELNTSHLNLCKQYYETDHVPQSLMNINNVIGDEKTNDTILRRLKILENIVLDSSQYIIDLPFKCDDYELRISDLEKKVTELEGGTTE